MPETNHLERARDELQRASDAADRPIQKQVDSLQEGLYEELDGELTQDEPGPKVDRISEVATKLYALEDETSGETRGRIHRAHTHLTEYLDSRSNAE